MQRILVFSFEKNSSGMLREHEVDDSKATMLHEKSVQSFGSLGLATEFQASHTFTFNVMSTIGIHLNFELEHVPVLNSGSAAAATTTIRPRGSIEARHSCSPKLDAMAAGKHLLFLNPRMNYAPPIQSLSSKDSKC